MARRYIVGICGGSGSGKTSFIKDLASLLPSGSVSIITQDNYYKPIEEQAADENGEVNFDLPTSIDRRGLGDDLSKLVNGESIFKKEYTFNDDRKEPELVEVYAAPVVIVEGLFVLHFEEVCTQMDLKVFLDVPVNAKLERRIKRDEVERGYDRQTVLYQWENHVMPAYRKYLQPYAADCDLVLSNNDNYDRGLAVLRDHIKSKLRILDELTLQSL